jgi:hypothetical protein
MNGMVIVCPMDAERDLVPALGARVIGLGGSCVRGLDKLVPHSALPILVIGLAGSLSQNCKPGSVYSVNSVVDSSGRIYKPGIHRLLAPLAVPEVRIACADTLVCSPQAKADLASATGASLVDMESAHIARWCAADRRSWSMIRAVLDGHDETLPPAMENWCGPDGRLRYHRVLISILANPLLVGKLPWLAQARTKAGAALREVFRGM